MPKPRVFISSTFYDLHQVRDDLERFVRDMGYEPVRHETGDIAYGSELPPEEYTYKEVETCDIVVSVIGGRFGSPSSDDANQSVSQRELRRALEKGIQVSIFVEKDVHSEFKTYQINKHVQGIKYRFVDDVRIYSFIEELYGLASNNPISSFETASNITDFLRAQWAGLFQRMLHETRQGSGRRYAGQRSGDRLMPAVAVAAGIARQFVGSIPIPEGLIEMKWIGGSSTLDVEVANTSSYVFDRMLLQLLEIHRWSDEQPQFIDPGEIYEKGPFAPLTLHTAPDIRNRVVYSPETRALLPEAPLRFLFLSVEDNSLQFSGQRGSSLGTYTIRSPGTWRVGFRMSLRPRQDWQGSDGTELTRKTQMFFRWDGATAPVPCEEPIAS